VGPGPSTSSRCGSTQAGFANNTTGVIYESGNLVEFWLAIPAVAWAAFVAWRRRSLPLTLIVLLFLAMWLPWTRIDRATFQYHVFSSLPFAVLALAYLLAELWHGPPPGAWLLARVAVALAILGPPLMWLFRQPLCALAGTNIVHPDGIACGPITRSTNVSEAAFVSVLVVLVGFSVLGWLLWVASRRPGPLAIIRASQRATSRGEPAGRTLRYAGRDAVRDCRSRQRIQRQGGLPADGPPGGVGDLRTGRPVDPRRGWCSARATAGVWPSE